MIEAYWSIIDWKALIAFFGLAGGAASPFLLAWWNGRAKNMETAAKQQETAAERVERIQREQYDNAIAERDYYKERVREANTDKEHDEAETDNAVRNGRAMENWAHHYKHGWANVAQRFRSLVSLFDQHLDGVLAAERARAILNEIKADMPQPPADVPLLRDATTHRPGEPKPTQ